MSFDYTSTTNDIQKINIVIPKKIKVDIASVKVVKIGADITAGSFFSFSAKIGIIVPRNLAKTMTNHKAIEDAKIIKIIEVLSSA